MSNAEKWVADHLGLIDRETREIAIRAYEAGQIEANNFGMVWHKASEPLPNT